jgi:hypothetical protein
MYLCFVWVKQSHTLYDTYYANDKETIDGWCKGYAGSDKYVVVLHEFPGKCIQRSMENSYFNFFCVMRRSDYKVIHVSRGKASGNLSYKYVSDNWDSFMNIPMESVKNAADAYFWDVATHQLCRTNITAYGKYQYLEYE